MARAAVILNKINAHSARKDRTYLSDRFYEFERKTFKSLPR